MQEFVREPKTDALVVSNSERRWFIQAAIHFETYCRTFFLHEKILFKRNKSVREAFFGDSNSYDVRKGAFYSITYYIFDQYLTMISTTSANLSILIPLTGDQSRQRSRWERQTRLEMLNFAHFLTSQGLGLIYKLQCMDISTQTDFMLEWFYKGPKAKIHWYLWSVESTFIAGELWRLVRGSHGKILSVNSLGVWRPFLGQGSNREPWETAFYMTPWVKARD